MSEGWPTRWRTNPDGMEPDPFVVLAFSGGGMRSAAFAQGALDRLGEWSRASSNLLDHVGVISSVSGGGFTAANFAINGPAGRDEYVREFVTRNVQWKDLLPHALRHHPVQFFTRQWSEILANWFGSKFLGRATFGYLHRQPDKPWFIPSATDISSGRRFTFTERDFRMIGQDLDNCSIGDAVAASSAFPGGLTPITFRNEAQGEDLPIWAKTTLEGGHHVNLAQYRLAEDWRRVRQDPAYRYIHLMDGGTSDNTGIRALVESLGSADRPSELFHLLEKERPSRFLFVLVNAKMRGSTKPASRAVRPWLPTILYRAGNASIDLRSDESASLLAQVLLNYGMATHRDLDTTYELPPEMPHAIALKPGRFAWVVQVSFDGLEEAVRLPFDNAGTNLNLGPELAKGLMRAAGDQLGRNDAFLEFADATGFTR